MAVAALALYLLWAVLAFGWRTLVQVRRTGDSGLRLHAEPGTVQWWAKLGFVGALAAGLAAPIAALAGLDDLAALDSDTLQIAGAVVALLGIAATVGAQLAMGASWRIGVDANEHTALVTTGVFGLVRNPIFTAMLITALGLTLMVPNVVAVIGLTTLVAALQVQVRLVEEPYLTATHGGAYRAYTATVGRFLPHIGRAA